MGALEVFSPNSSQLHKYQFLGPEQMARESHILFEHLVHLGIVTVQFNMQFGSQNAILRPLDLILFSHNLKIGVFWNFSWQVQAPIQISLMDHVS